MDVLSEKFPGRIISRYGDVNWPPISCDITPLDFFGVVMLRLVSTPSSSKGFAVAKGLEAAI